MKKILIIEDEKSLAEMLEKHLSKQKYETVTVSDGEDALEIMKRFTPDLILLDVVLPTMDGITFLEIMNQNVSMMGIPVILISNLEDREKMTRAAELGVTLYFIKANLSLKVLSQWVKELLEDE